MSEPTKCSYDEIPYPSDPFRQTHPSAVATIATLLGMQPTPVDRCRVLEIGSASGGNLVPMALEFPESKFMGIDLSSRQIAAAKETVSVLGLQNVEFKAMNVMEIEPDFGQFDYIICHGVYSWVPDEVADKILDVCVKNLTPTGVSYVSYNTLPGWHMRGMIRDMMCYHTRQFQRPPMKIRQARALLKFLAESVPSEKNPYGMYLRNELEMLQKMRDSYIFHEHLEKENNPVYFHQFAERAEKKGLQFLGEAAFGAMALAAHDLPSKVMTTLRQVSTNVIHREQYMDFVRNRTFRQTLLCHRDVKLDRALNAQNMTPLYVASQAKPVKDDADIHAAEPMEFKAANNITLPIRQPITKAALLHLGQAWPASVRFDALQAAAHLRLGPQAPSDEQATRRELRMLAASFQSLFALSFLELNVRELPTSPPLGEQPVASRLVRLQAQSGRLVTNLRHRMIAVDEFERRLLEHLDGNHSRKQLLEIVEGLVANGSLVVRKNGDRSRNREEVTKLLTDSIDRSLNRFQTFHLLTA